MSLPHAKHVGHVRARATAGTVKTATVTAVYVPELEVANDHGIKSWGVILSHRDRHPLDGMHLFPDAVEWLPGQLRACAAALDVRDVAIEHLENGGWLGFANVDPAHAGVLAAAIEKVTP